MITLDKSPNSNLIKLHAKICGHCHLTCRQYQKPELDWKILEINQDIFFNWKYVSYNKGIMTGIRLFAWCYMYLNLNMERRYRQKEMSKDTKLTQYACFNFKFKPWNNYKCSCIYWCILLISKWDQLWSHHLSHFKLHFYVKRCPAFLAM